MLTIHVALKSRVPTAQLELDTYTATIFGASVPCGYFSLQITLTDNIIGRLLLLFLLLFFLLFVFVYC